MDSHALWRFAVERYAVAGVAERCLALQDEHGLDVNVVFACLYWATVSTAPLDEAGVAALLDTVEAEREWVAGVRAVRRAAKQRVDEHPRIQGLYDALEKTELHAENVEQAGLLAALEDRAPGGEAGTPVDASAVALASLRAYASVAESERADPVLKSLVALVLA